MGGMIQRLGALFAGPKAEQETTRKAVASARLFKPDWLSEVMNLLEEVGDPDMMLEKLGRTRADLRALETDDEIYQCLDTRLGALLAAPWRIEHSSQEVTDWLRHELDRHYEAAVAGTWSALGYGYSVIRPVYREPEDKQGWIGGLKAVGIPNFEEYKRLKGGTWGRKPEGKPVEPLEPWEQEYLYLITVRKPTNRNPYGEALHSRAYWAWYFRVNGWQFWMQFLERFGSPFTIGKGSDPDTMASRLAQALQDAVVAVGPDDSVEVVQPTGSGEAFERAEQNLVKRIQKLYLGQTYTSEQGKNGSYAAANVGDRVRKDKRDSDIRLVTPTMQRLVRSLAVLRFGEQVGAEAAFVIEDDKGLQLDRAERDAKLVTAGVVRFKPEYISRVYDLEPDDFEVPSGDSGSTDPQGASLAGGVGAHFATGSRFTPPQQVLEGLSDAALKKAGSPVPSESILKAIKASSSPEELYDKLLALYEGNDGGSFAEVLERALFAADVVGYVAEEGGEA